MIIEAKLKYALKEMLRTMPLEKINVTALCEKCGCHRQTFYYHYQDIYDLVAAICLNEDLSAVEKAEDVQGVLTAFIQYIKENFSFLRAAYNSAAKDLIDDFIFGKINAVLVALWIKESKTNGLKKEGVRNAARRYSHFIADEFGNCFKDQKLTPERFGTKMVRFSQRSIDCVLPAIFELSKAEETK